MNTKISFFPVGNGDMTLIQLKSGRTILIDCNIRSDCPDDFDTLQELKELLSRDENDRPYVDVLALSHPDQDHCRGMKEHFHLSPLDEYNDKEDKIVVREMWSSPMAFRRASKIMPFCEDAKAFHEEARRRANHYKSNGSAQDGDRIKILGEDEDGKTDDLTNIVVKAGNRFNQINGAPDSSVEVKLLGPSGKEDNDEEELKKAKNKSSTILRFDFESDGDKEACKLLTGGDAEVVIWENIQNTYEAGELEYDILQTPHHCSWHSLSHDSWSEMGEDAEVSQDAKKALSQARRGAYIVSSSKEVKDDDNDPPCVRAKREYQGFGTFICTGDTPEELLIFEVTGGGPKQKKSMSAANIVTGAAAIGKQRIGHG